MAHATLTRFQFTLRGLFLLTFIVALAVGGWLWLSGPRYSLPPRQNIASIEVTHKFYAIPYNRTIPAFVIPREHWDAILSAVEPCEHDGIPKTWVCLCDLRIHTKSDRAYRVSLFWLDGPVPGAFAISPAEESGPSTYYRGGDSRRLCKAIVAAYDDAFKLQREENERK